MVYGEIGTAVYMSTGRDMKNIPNGANISLSSRQVKALSPQAIEYLEKSGMASEEDISKIINERSNGTPLSIKITQSAKSDHERYLRNLD